jgi:hypothetical protein
MLKSKAEKIAHLSKELHQAAEEYKQMIERYEPNCTEEVEGFEQPPHSVCIKRCKTCEKVVDISE